MKWEVLAIIVTFLLGIGNLFYNWRINKRTTFINSVTAERIKWIHSLRESISTFCGKTYYWVMTPDLPPDESQNIIKQIDKLRMLIKLQLNPNGSHDSEIIRLLDEIPLYTQPTNSETIKRLIQDMINTSQLLLKEEWGKVKEESKKGDLKD